MKKICLMVFIALLNLQTNAQTTEVAKANNMFAFDLFQKLSEKETGNIFFSPLSLTSALGMTYAGANSETQSQIEKVFHFPHGDKKIHAQLGNIQKKFSGLSSDGIEVSMVNKLWAEKTYKINNNYSKQLKKDYSAAIELVDFIKQPESARSKINNFIADQTKNKITELLPSGSINSLARLVLTNAIYFKGNWQNQFDSKKTKEADFFVAPLKKASCQMMSQTGSFKFCEGDGFQTLELPYKGESLSMLIILPEEGINIDQFQKKLSFDKLNSIQEELSNHEVWVLFPRFKSSTGYQLKPLLTEMGMPVPFSNDADFSVINSKKDLKIFDIFHKAFIEVNEKGTEAAAATAVVIGIKSVQRSFKFEANRPFIYLIRDTKSGIILFMGKLSNPSSN